METCKLEGMRRFSLLRTRSSLYPQVNKDPFISLSLSHQDSSRFKVIFSSLIDMVRAPFSLSMLIEDAHGEDATRREPSSTGMTRGWRRSRISGFREMFPLMETCGNVNGDRAATH